MNDKLAENQVEAQIPPEFLQKLEKASEEGVKNSLYAMVASQVPELAKKD